MRGPRRNRHLAGKQRNGAMEAAASQAESRLRKLAFVLCSRRVLDHRVLGGEKYVPKRAPPPLAAPSRAAHHACTAATPRRWQSFILACKPGSCKTPLSVAL